MTRVPPRPQSRRVKPQDPGPLGAWLSGIAVMRR